MPDVLYTVGSLSSGNETNQSDPKTMKTRPLFVTAKTFLASCLGLEKASLISIEHFIYS